MAQLNQMIAARLLLLPVAGGLLLIAAGAGAQSLDEARAAYTEGRFQEAADLGQALATSDAYTLAAQSLAVYAHFEVSRQEWSQVIGRAMKLGEEAVQADPTNPEAYCQLAHAVGRYAQRLGPMEALRKGLPKKVRRAAEAALAVDPDYPGAHLTLGGWHADVAAAGFFARKVLGASRKKAVYHYERALERAPESKILLYEYGSRLPALDKGKGRQRATEMLQKALGLPAQDVYESHIHREITEALAALTGS